MISIIAAVARNGVIGDRNQLIWHISEDMKHFKKVTSGHTIIMGRKTFESLGRLLPNRKNIIVTRNKNLKIEGCTVVGSFEEAIALNPEEEVFVIGGGEIYAYALKFANKLYLTIVEHDYEGDTKFPTIDFSQWHLTDQEIFVRGEKFEHPFTFKTYERI